MPPSSILQKVILPWISRQEIDPMLTTTCNGISLSILNLTQDKLNG